MKDFIPKCLDYVLKILGAVYSGFCWIQQRTQGRGTGSRQTRQAPRPTPQPGIEPRTQATLAPAVPSCVLLTCFEPEQPMFLEALNISDPGYTAFDTVVCLRVAGRIVYLTPSLFDAHARLTWAVLRMASGGAEREAVAVPIHNTPEGKSGTLSPQDVEVLAEATYYFGIDLAMIPLAEELRADLRTILEELQALLGPRLCILECHKDIVNGWPAPQRRRRFEIWSEIFKGLNIRKEQTDVSRKSDSP